MRGLAPTNLIIFCLSGLVGAATPDPFTPPNLPPPQFKAANFDVRSFGAIGNGSANDTEAINRAIEKCSASGGGDVHFPAGTYLAASIHLRSNVRFVLDNDAVISGADSGYDPPEPNKFERYQDFGHSHFHNALMWGENIENFAIVGGHINGGHISEEDELRGRDIGDKVIVIKSSRNILFHGITHENGGHMVYLLNDCENVAFANIVIKKSRDGVNLVSCRNVQMHDCHFTGCGDDTVALKSDYALGRKIASANIYLWNCYLESAANALEIGAETVGDFTNVNFSDIRIGRAWKAGVGIRSVNGSVIDSVRYRNISMKSVDVPVSLVVGNRLLMAEPNEKPGAIRNVTITNLTASEPRPRRPKLARPSLIAGLPESPIENILIEHATIVGKGSPGKEVLAASPQKQKAGRAESAFTASGFYVSDARNVQLRDITMSYETVDPRPTLIARSVSGLELDQCNFQKFSGVPLMRLQGVNGLSVRGSKGMSDRLNAKVDLTEE